MFSRSRERVHLRLDKRKNLAQRNLGKGMGFSLLAAAWFMTDVWRNLVTSFFKRIAIKMGCFLIPLILWKVISTDWIVTIPKTSGGVVRFYPENSPLWATPKPTPPFTDFRREIVAKYGSGAGPSLRTGTVLIRPNWLMMIAKISAIMMIVFSVFAIREIWRSMFQAPKVEQ